MRLYITILLALGFTIQAVASDIYMTRSGEIRFYSSMPLEDIEADNNSVTCILKTKTGEMAFMLFMKSFSFDRAAMQEHFNKDYLHTDEFPKATFEGDVSDMAAIDLTADGKHEVTVSGKLTIHGVTNEVEEQGTIEVLDGKVKLHSVFMIELDDYDVKVPTNMIKSINNEIEITVSAELAPYER